MKTVNLHVLFQTIVLVNYNLLIILSGLIANKSFHICLSSHFILYW